MLPEGHNSSNATHLMERSTSTNSCVLFFWRGCMLCVGEKGRGKVPPHSINLYSMNKLYRGYALPWFHRWHAVVLLYQAQEDTLSCHQRTSVLSDHCQSTCHQLLKQNIAVKTLLKYMPPIAEIKYSCQIIVKVYICHQLLKQNIAVKTLSKHMLPISDKVVCTSDIRVGWGGGGGRKKRERERETDRQTERERRRRRKDNFEPTVHTAFDVL